jgi:signal transduction histidine kinase
MLKSQDKYNEENDVFNLMIEELDRGNAIITEFLSLTKDKIVQLDLKNLNSIVSNLFPLLQAQAMEQDKNIEVRLEKVPDLLLDEKEIRQLMLNLVRNGLEAMAPGGTLTIRTYMKDSRPVLSIQDQGHGMDDEVVGKLGTPFFTTKDDGTGLGMAVCYGIIERHKAKIDIDTSPAGTRFSIIFPH